MKVSRLSLSYIYEFSYRFRCLFGKLFFLFTSETQKRLIFISLFKVLEVKAQVKGKWLCLGSGSRGSRHQPLIIHSYVFHCPWKLDRETPVTGWTRGSAKTHTGRFQAYSECRFTGVEGLCWLLGVGIIADSNSHAKIFDLL